MPVKETLYYPHEIRKRVDAEMAKWAEHPDFGSLFGALLKANDISEEEFARRSKIAASTVRNYRDGTPPTYESIEKIVSSNALNFNPDLIDTQQVAFFTKAKLIEVTYDSTRDFNRDVLAGVALKLKNGIPQHWADVMRKLFDFHTQGERTSIKDIQSKIEKASKGEVFAGLKYERISKILNKLGEPSKEEIAALYKYLNLSPEQIVQMGDERLVREIEPAPQKDDNNPLNALLDSLPVNKLELAELSKNKVTQKYGFSRKTLNEWGKEGAKLKLASMRALVDVLHPFVKDQVIHQDAIDGLIRHFGFTAEKLTATAHDVILKADKNTAPINQLLGDIRDAADLAVEIADIVAMKPVNPKHPLTASQIGNWEKGTAIPSKEQVEELLKRYSKVIEDKKHQELLESPAHDIAAEVKKVEISASDISKVVAIAGNSLKRRTEMKPEEKKALRTESWREMITPDVAPYKGR